MIEQEYGLIIKNYTWELLKEKWPIIKKVFKMKLIW